MQALHTKIHDALRQDVEKSVYKMGSRLPSERELAASFGVSRMTLRQAIQTLCDEGILERRVGSGTYVVGSRVRERMRGTTSFTEIVTAQGKKASSRVLSFKKQAASALESEKLGLRQGSPIIKMERIRFADNEPICFEIAALPFTIVADFSEEEITKHFFASITAHGKVIGHSEQTISAGQSTEELAKYLQIKTGSAVLLLSQVSYLSDETAFEYVRSSYVGNRFEFYLER